MTLQLRRDTHEIWAAVPGYEGFYEASTHGRVRSVTRVIEQTSRWGAPMARTLQGCVLSEAGLSSGYKTLVLRRGGHARSVKLHVVIARTFLGPRPAGLHVAHRDGDKLNNALSSLRYATAKENADDKLIHGTAPLGEAVYCARLTADDVKKIRAERGTLLAITADRFGISPQHVCAIQLRRRWAHI